MPEIQIPNYDDYVDSIVAFVDILGFDKEARNIEDKNKFDTVKKPLAFLKEMETLPGWDPVNLKNLQITAVSDSLILSMPFNDIFPSAMTLIHVLHWLQFEILSQCNKLIRGFITKGKVYHKNGYLFGEAYSKAFENEKTSGHAPRIVVDSFLIDTAKKAISDRSNSGDPFFDTIENYIFMDSGDGCYFLDYLKPVGVLARIDKQQLRNQREKIKQFIERSIKEFSKNFKILRKYKWLENYYNLTECHFDQH
jgi:hypothetical protein